MPGNEHLKKARDLRERAAMARKVAGHLSLYEERNKLIAFATTLEAEANELDPTGDQIQRSREILERTNPMVAKRDD